MSTIDVSYTTTILKYIEKKDYDTAYKVACLGFAESDFKILGTEALTNKNFEIAKKVWYIYIYIYIFFSPSFFYNNIIYLLNILIICLE